MHYFLYILKHLREKGKIIDGTNGKTRKRGYTETNLG